MTDTERITTQKVWSVGEMQRRPRNLHALMDELSLDAVILTSLHNVLYYTGFFCPPFGRLNSAVNPRNGEHALIVSLIEDVGPQYCCYHDDIRSFHDWETSPLENNVRLFGEVLRDNGIASDRLSYEEDSVSVAFEAMIDSALGGYAALEAMKPGVTEADNVNMCWVQTGPYRSLVGHIMNAATPVRIALRRSGGTGRHGPPGTTPNSSTERARSKARS